MIGGDHLVAMKTKKEIEAVADNVWARIFLLLSGVEDRDVEDVLGVIATRIERYLTKE